MKMTRAQREYKVTFVTLNKYNPVTRSVIVKSTHSMNALALLYRMYGRNKIKVISAKKVEKNEIQ